MVDQAHEHGAGSHRGGLRHSERHLEHGVGASLQVGGRAALQQCDCADHDPAQAGAEDDRAGEDDRRRRGREHRQRRGGDRHAERAGAALCGSRHQPRRREAGGDRAGALDGEEHAEERGGAVQAVVDHGEEDRFAQAERDDRERARNDEPAQDGCRAHVGEAGAELLAGQADRALPARLTGSHESDGSRGGEEGERVEPGDGGAPEGCEDAGAGERREEPQALAQGLDRRVAVSDEFAGQHRHQQRRLSRSEHRRGRAERQHDRIDDPDVTGVVNQRERRDGDRAEEVDRDEQRPLAEAIDEQAGGGRGELGEDEREEGEAGGAVAAGQLLHPDAHGQREGEIAEQGERLASEIEPCVAQREELAHAQSSPRSSTR
jgi:hypothetical protein